MFYQNEEHNLAVAQIPKSGLNTIANWLGKGFLVVPNDQVVVGIRVAFIRNPLERLKSCYSFMHWQSVRRGDGPIDWHDLVDRVFSDEDNEHWRPQATHISGVDCVVHRFENLSRHYQSYWPGLLDHFNKATRMPTDDYRYDELVEFYKDDQRLWDNTI